MSKISKMYEDLEKEINKTKTSTREVEEQREEIEKVLFVNIILDTVYCVEF